MLFRSVPPSQELIDDPVGSPIKVDDDDSESNDWAEQLHAQSPGYEPLDWGSDPEDNEACVHLLSHFPSTHKPAESHQPLKRLSSLTDGSCSYNITLSNYICEHGIVYALCAKCRNCMPSKMGTLWLLDSGASSHFTHDLNDFIEYRKLPPHCYDLFPFLLIYLLFCLSLCAAPCLALFAFLCACLIAYLCMVLGHILHDT